MGTVKYMFLLRSAVETPPADSTVGRALFDEWVSAIERMATAGVLLECAPFVDASMATTVRVREGEALLSDGPATEVSEQVVGYTIVECADLDDALKWASSVPPAKNGCVEVREVINPEVIRAAHA